MTKLAADLYLPLIISNILHMFVVKRDLLSFLKIPISEAQFGKNKTYRGIIFVGSITSVCYGVLTYRENQLSPYLIGFILGLTYSLFELPNSWLKRLNGIAPGTKPKDRTYLFTFFDKTDSAFGVALIYTFLFQQSFVEFLFLFTFASILHLVFSYLFLKIKIKESL